ncbi:MAG: hypothetical protein ACFFAH_08250 [Promethearchaeota archaeon]
MSDTAINNEKIQNEVYTKLESINEKSRNYINDVVVIINKKIGIDNLSSIILFGSQRGLEKKKAEHTSVSDCDLLIILNDNVSTSFIKKIEKYFIALEIKHHFREDNNSGFVSKLLYLIHSTTGMFMSHFLTKEKYWKNIVFHKIFRVNKFLSKLFAPTKIVLCSVVANSSILYGKDLREIVEKIEISLFDMIKSLLMNLMIALFSILTSILKSFNSIKHQLEAVKWSLRAVNYYIYKDSKSLEDITARFTLFEKSGRFFKYKKHAKTFYNRFLNLREKPHTDLGFILRCPFRIFKIHLKGIVYKKVANN